MKKKVLAFVYAALFLLSILPAANLLFRHEANRKWWRKSVLYNLDLVLAPANDRLYRLGISTNPSRAIIGRYDWLYLGDFYENCISTKRRSSNSSDMEKARKIGLATQAWEKWYRLKGVRHYGIILAPDKETIYPEFLPDWARPAANSVTDALFSQVDRRIYFDTRPALKQAKAEFSYDLYYKTDSHWNPLGAYVAFRAFAEEFSRTDREFKWYPPQLTPQTIFSHWANGDLARLLRMKGKLQDDHVELRFPNQQESGDEAYYLETGGHDVNPEDLTHPVVVKSKYALNAKKVLWLRDSFGVRMTPVMSAAFAETLQIYYLGTDPARLTQLVDAYQPDYVLLTTAERLSRSSWFENFPPPIVSSGRRSNFVAVARGMPPESNDLKKVEDSPTYQISGSDPYLDFSLSGPVDGKDSQVLLLDFLCLEKTGAVEAKVSWRVAGAEFTEANSADFPINPGINTIDFSALPPWTQAGAIAQLRVGFKSPKSCSIFNLNRLELGK